MNEMICIGSLIGIYAAMLIITELLFSPRPSKKGRRGL